MVLCKPTFFAFKKAKEDLLYLIYRDFNKYQVFSSFKAHIDLLTFF